MTTQNRSLEADDSLCFHVESSHRSRTSGATLVRELCRHSADCYVSVSAARISSRRGKKHSCGQDGKPGPGGPTDPDLALVQVEIIHANYGT